MQVILQIWRYVSICSVIYLAPDNYLTKWWPSWLTLYVARPQWVNHLSVFRFNNITQKTYQQNACAYFTGMYCIYLPVTNVIQHTYNQMHCCVIHWISISICLIASFVWLYLLARATYGIQKSNQMETLYQQTSLAVFWGPLGDDSEMEKTYEYSMCHNKCICFLLLTFTNKRQRTWIEQSK